MKPSLLNYVESQVARFRNSVGLSDSEAINLKSLVLKLNVLTVFSSMSDSFSGMSLKGNGQRFMLINSRQPLCRQNFTIAHELYHLYMEENPKPHKYQEEGKRSESEQCVDAFALMLLMPADGVRQMIPENELKAGSVSLATVLRLGHYFGTSHKAVLNRLSDLNLIKREEKKVFSGIPVKRASREYGYDTNLYESANQGLVIGDFGEKARKLFESDKISEGHYNELLRKIGVNGSED